MDNTEATDYKNYVFGSRRDFFAYSEKMGVNLP